MARVAAARQIRGRVRILTQNLRSGGGKRVTALVTSIAECDPDVAVLTEFRIGQAGTALLEALAGYGYRDVVHGSPPARSNSTVLISRLPLGVEDVPNAHHRIVAASVGGISLRGIYLPLNAAKVVFWDEYLAPAISALGERPAVFIGDFNTGASDERPPRVRYFAEDRYLALLTSGWVDAVRSQNLGPPAFTWFSHVGNGFTLDHALVSPLLASRISSATVIHAPRLAGLTDHSGVMIDLDW